MAMAVVKVMFYCFSDNDNDDYYDFSGNSCFVKRFKKPVCVHLRWQHAMMYDVV
jgi:hypothetical protein